MNKSLYIEKILCRLKQNKFIYSSYKHMRSVFVRPAFQYNIMYKKVLRRSKICLEIGGLSDIFDFNGIFNFYSHIKRLDICNHSENTRWSINYTEKTLPERFRKLVGNFIYLDGTDLHEIKDNTYDVVLSSHVLEHIANPVKALKEWARVIKPDGYIITVVPNKYFSVDNKRDYTSTEHIIEDYIGGITENDQTHVDEFLSRFDYEMAQSSYEDFKDLVAHVADNKCLHHHVFSEKTIREIFEYINFEVVDLFIHEVHIVVLARRAINGNKKTLF